METLMGAQKLRVGMGLVALFEDTSVPGDPKYFLHGGYTNRVDATRRIYERNQNFKYCLRIPADRNPYRITLVVVYSLRLAEITPVRSLASRKVTQEHWEARKEDFIRSFGEQYLAELVAMRPEARNFQDAEETGELEVIARTAAEGCGFDIRILEVAGSTHPIRKMDPFDVPLNAS